ncbi:MAG: TRIC cation channel family protein [Flavobacteriales bacterium]
MGTITASFGGVVRNVLYQGNPIIFRKEIYESTCIFGGILFFTLQFCQISQDYIYEINILNIFLIRITDVRYHLNFPSMYTSRKKSYKMRKYSTD